MTSVPRGKEPEPGKFARAFSEQVRISMAQHRVTGSDLARMTGRSQSYISKRLRDEASFSANDCEVICEVLHEDMLEFVTAAIRSIKK
jgi:transcriptional regulator with XRE-family HTH domain